jgi:hypothetical protein
VSRISIAERITINATWTSEAMTAIGHLPGQLAHPPPQQVQDHQGASPLQSS